MNPTATLVLDRTSLGLADHLKVTLTIEATSILTVTPPKLSTESAANWHIRPVQSARVDKVATGERWVQVYQLDPYQPGDAVPLAFAAVTVTTPQSTTTLEIPPKTVAVSASIREASINQARSVVGFEAPLTSPPDPERWPILLGAAVLTISLAAWWKWRSRSPVPPETTDWLTELSRLRGSHFAERLADGVRQELIVRHQVPANCRTTAELDGIADPIARELLAWCDRIKFAREHPTDTACEAAFVRVKEWRNAHKSLSPATISG